MLEKYKSLPWPRNLWSAVFQREVAEEELPTDWVETLEYVLGTLKTAKRRNVLTLYFRDGMTTQEISDSYETCLSTIRQQISKMVALMRHPTRQIFLVNGLKSVQNMPTTHQGTDQVLAEAIDVLNLSPRTWNCLRRAGIETVKQLIQYTDRQLLMFRNMGPGSLQEIRTKLSGYGLALKE